MDAVPSAVDHAVTQTNPTPATTSAREAWVDEVMGRLDIDQKVGQLLVLGSAGPLLTPQVRELVSRHHIGGLRVAQKFFPGSSEGRDPARFPEAYYRSGPDTMSVPANLRTRPIGVTPREYARTLNELREIALDRPGSVGLHFAFDQEGEGADMLFRQRLLPFPMGLVSSGDPDLVHRAAVAVGRQARALGLNMIHSPVLDVNTNPANPEIGPRAYSDDPDVVTEYALATLAGLSATQLMATGKHFPGRGASDQDAHHGLPVIDMPEGEFRTRHLAPFAALIRAGLPCIMAAFTAYPMLGGGDEPAATSRRIITGVLREEHGFTGVVTTDNMEMRGLLDRYDMGLAEAGGLVDPEAADLFDDPQVVATTREAAERSVTVLRDDQRLLPLRSGARVLLVEQAHHFHSFINDLYSHPGLLWEEMHRHSADVRLCLVNETVTDDDRAAIRAALAADEHDLVVVTSYYNYRSGATMVPLLDEVLAAGKPVVVVANTPYRRFGVPDQVGTAVVSYCPSGRENLAAVADVLHGKLQAGATLGIGTR